MMRLVYILAENVAKANELFKKVFPEKLAMTLVDGTRRFRMLATLSIYTP